MQTQHSSAPIVAIKSIIYSGLILSIPTAILWIMAALEVTFAVVYPIMTPRVFIMQYFPLLGLLTVIATSLISVYHYNNRSVKKVARQSTIVAGIVVVIGFVISFLGLI